MNREELLKEIEKKYDDQGIPIDTMLEGLLWSEQMKYWDYIQTDALLGLQIKRTNLPDEMVVVLFLNFLTVLLYSF